MKKNYSFVISVVFCFSLLVVSTISHATISLITGPTSVCQGRYIALADTVGGGTGSWSSSDITIATINPSSGVLYGVASGTVVVSYVAGTTTNTATIIVNPSSVPGPIVGGSNVCIGTITILADTPAGGSWAASNTSASVTTGGDVSGNYTGTDTVWYIVTNGTCTDSAAQVMNVYDVPKPTNITGGDTVCQRATITLYDSAAGPGTWEVSNVDVAITASGAVTGRIPGTDTVYYIETNSCGSYTNSLSLTVEGLPTVSRITPLIPAPPPASVCLTETLQLTDSTLGGTWVSTSPNASISATGLVTGLISGRAPIQYIVTNNCGSTTARINVTVDSPYAGTITGANIVCSGVSITLFAGFGGFGPGANWSSDFGYISPIGGGIYTAFSTADTNLVDTATFTVNNACGTLVSTYAVTVSPSPNPGIISGNDTVCAGTHIIVSDTTGYGGIWSTSNSNAAITGAGEVLGITAGTDTVIYTAATACGSATAILPIVVLPTGCVKSAVNNVINTNANNIIVFPNPASSSFTLTIPGTDEATVTIFDLYGRKVSTYMADRNERELNIGTGNMANGTYIINVTEGSASYKEAIIITK